MALGKRKRVSASRAVKTSMRVGNWASLARASRRPKALRGRLSMAYLSQRLSALTRTIETKEGTNTFRNFQLPHNNLVVINRTDGTVWNPFLSVNGASDEMGQNQMQRLGDSICVQRLRIKFFVETSLQRTNVHFKFYLVKMAKGDVLNRANFFKNSANNKMIDDINTERFTVLAQKTVRVTTPNVGPSTIGATGIGSSTSIGTGGTRIVTMSVPGSKFGRGGNVTYENQSTSQVKFFDYRLCCVAYDWYGTPQDDNNVGFVNEGFTKLYFKDA